MQNEIVYYWDIYNKKLTNKRKKDLKFGYIGMIAILVAYSFIGVSFLFMFVKDKRFIFFLLFFILGLIVAFFGLRYVFIVDEKAAVITGIKLTSQKLTIYRREYPLSSILHAEVVDFLGSGGVSGSDRFMVLVVLENGKKKVKLIRSDETEDILRLSNLIRKLKNLPEQKIIKKYGAIGGYYQWKKEILKKY